MPLSKLAAASIALAVATGPNAEAPRPQLSLQQKNTAARAFVQPVTDCIARSIVSDSRFRKDDPTINRAELIVDAVPKCLTPVHAMIAAYDQYFGEGMGEDFFMGPYLDTLPNALLKRMNAGAP
jgi:hypothetical protein